MSTMPAMPAKWGRDESASGTGLAAVVPAAHGRGAAGLAAVLEARAPLHGARMLESDGGPGGPVTFEWPDGTRFSIHGGGAAPMPDGSSVPPAFVPGEPVHCARCDGMFRQGAAGSRTHVAAYPGTGGGSVELAVHECPDCALQLSEEESAAAAREFIETTFAEVMEAAEGAEHLADGKVH